MKISMLRTASLIALATCALSAQAALFELKYTVDAINADLFLTTTSIAGSPGQFLITGVSGTRSGLSVDFFQAGGPGMFLSDDGRYLLDNVLYNPANPTYVDFYSFEYGTVDGNRINLYVNNDQYLEVSLDSYPMGKTVTNVSLTAVPNPDAPGPAAGATFTLMALRRRRKA